MIGRSGQQLIDTKSAVVEPAKGDVFSNTQVDVGAQK